MLTLDSSGLKKTKNLLAFSAGVDSSALFFLLVAQGISFDIAIVDYGIRVQSQEEVAHAKTLARQHRCFCHTIKAPQFSSHFEAKARKFRYEFFESLITCEGYDTLLTAHQLNDQLEWMLMRLTKGAGVTELLGLEPKIKKEHYTLLRPLLSYTKEELLTYLNSHKYPYFIDQSNYDDRYERNHFREQFSNALLSQYKEGIERSFEYLRKDKTLLLQQFQTIGVYHSLHVILLTQIQAKTKAVDITLKKLGYLLSAGQRQEVEKESSLVIGGKWLIELQDHTLYIAPFVNATMPKKFKEQCRHSHIPHKLRPYLYQKMIEPSLLAPSITSTLH